MDEDAARAWVRGRFGVSRETALGRYTNLLIAESEHQNLIAASTIDTIWTRHIVDSAQLVPLTDAADDGAWVDIGSGAGLPGIVAAILTEREVVLVEPRARRVEFLETVVNALSMAPRVRVIRAKAEAAALPKPAAILSARAVMELSALFASAGHLADRTTTWVLPKGARAQSEVEAARRAWQGSFHVEQSITHPESLIVLAQEVRPR